MGDLLGSPRVAPLLFAVRFEPHFSIHSFFFCCSSSPTLCARAVTSGFPPQRCLRWGPPLVGAGPLRIIVEFQNLFSYNCRESNLLRAHMIVARRREKFFFFFEKTYFFTATMQTCKVLFTLAPVASHQINRKSSLPFSGAIIPALKHRIPSELRS